MDARSFSRRPAAWWPGMLPRAGPCLTAILGTAILAASLCGCQSAWRGGAAADSLADAAADRPPAPPVDKSRPDAATAAAASQAAAAAPGDPTSPALSAAAVAAGSAALADDRWVQAVPAPEGPPSKYRWRHFGLEGFLARGSWQAELTAALAAKQAELIAALSDKQAIAATKGAVAATNPTIVATNAAILLARGGSADGGGGATAQRVDRRRDAADAAALRGGRGVGLRAGRNGP